MSSLNIIDTLDNLQGEALEKLRVLTREEDLETWRVVFLGRKGKLTSILRAIKAFSYTHLTLPTTPYV